MKLDFQISEMPLIPIIGKTMKFVEVLINNSFKENDLDLTKNQFILLKYVYSKSLPQTSLTVITECNKSSLTRLINSLENKEMVTRETSSEDRRINNIKITKKGKSEFKKAQPIMDSIFDEILKGVGTDEQKIVKQVFEKMMQNTKNEIEKLSVAV